MSRMSDAHVDLADEVRSLLIRNRMTGTDVDADAHAVYEMLESLGVTSMERLHPDATREFEPGSCEWPTTSSWRMGTCGRSGASASKYCMGLRLCWQHEDSLWHEAYSRAEYMPSHVANALVKRVIEAKGDATLDDLVTARVTELLQEYQTRGPWTHEHSDLIDRIIDERLRERWSA